MLGPEQDAPSFVHADWGGSACDIGLYSSRKRHVRESPADRSGCQLAFQAVAKPTFKTPKGTRDILPGEADRQRALVNTFGEAARRAGYGHVMTPMFEDLGVFLRVGEETDVVTKEMYDFEDRDGRRIALRPEMTAGAVRAFVQHKPLLPWKVWYDGGPVPSRAAPSRAATGQFEPGRGRGAGQRRRATSTRRSSPSPGTVLRQSLGLRQVRLLLNSLGDATATAGAISDAVTSATSRPTEASLSEAVAVATLERQSPAGARLEAPERTGVWSLTAPTMAEFLSR